MKPANIIGSLLTAIILIALLSAAFGQKDIEENLPPGPGPRGRRGRRGRRRPWMRGWRGWGWGWPWRTVRYPPPPTVYPYAEACVVARDDARVHCGRVI